MENYFSIKRKQKKQNKQRKILREIRITINERREKKTNTLSRAVELRTGTGSENM